MIQYKAIHNELASKQHTWLNTYASDLVIMRQALETPRGLDEATNWQMGNLK